MNASSKIKKSIIAIIISLCLIVGAIFGIIFSPKINSVKADYDYGTYNENGYYVKDGVVFYGVKVKVEDYELNGETPYWPQYDTNGNLETIKFGEAVLLKENEAILLCFARQGEGAIASSKQVDYLNSVFVELNGKSENNEIENNVSKEGDVVVKEFGYLIDPNEIVDSNLQKLGVNSGKEGKVEIFINEFECDGKLGSFSFMFYVFKEGTYQRTENLNSENPFVRPATQIVANNYVVDSTTKEQYYSENFYFYKNQNLPYLEFDPTRYEVLITKTIHKTSTLYSFNLNNSATSNQKTELNQKVTTIVDQIGENKFAQTINQDLSTLDIYARPLRVEVVSNERVRVYFENLGEYSISYSAVYYDEEGKVYLENLNKDKRQDKLSIFGTELTYVDFEKGQTPFRNESNTISADLTGILNFVGGGANNFIVNGNEGTLTLSNSTVIASTNQPPVELMFNSVVKTFNVWHSATKTGIFTNKSSSYTTDFVEPGYYVIEVVSSYDGFKSWGAANTAIAQTAETTQYYVFEIKAQTSNLDLYVLDEGGNPTEQRVYTNSFVKNGIEIKDFQATSEFDSSVYFEITKQNFGNGTIQKIVLPTEEFDELSSSQIQALASFGITKHDGYYILKPADGISVDGEYSVSLCFGKSGKETINFKLDTQEISGISAYRAESIYGSEEFNVGLIANQGTIALTNKPFALNWNEKQSGAKISASYVRFALSEKEFSTTASDYVLNQTWLANDFAVVLNEANAKTTYEKMEIGESGTIKGDFVVSETGLYVFKLEDEAGHVQYYAVLVDDSVPTILIKPSGTGNEKFVKASKVNNVNSATNIMFGTHKAISINLINGGEQNPLTTLAFSNTTAGKYLSEFFANLNEFDKNGIVAKANNNYFFAIPIVSVYEKVGNAETKIILENGAYVRTAPLGENNELLSAEFNYQIFDASNSSKNNPTTFTTLNFNTDQTGLMVFTDKNNKEDSSLSLVATKTQAGAVEKYFSATTETNVYLNWTTLYPKNQNYFVDVANDGLKCEFYELVYNKEKNTYEYSSTPIEIQLFVNVDGQKVEIKTLSEDELKKLNNEKAFEVEFNVVNGKTQQGKYVITRTYSIIDESKPINFNDDHQISKTVVFIDRNRIISATDSNGENVGYYTYVTTFDGGNSKEYFNNLYSQSQTSENYVLQTNQLPIGFYIPNAKYGTVNLVSNGFVQIDNFLNKTGEGGLQSLEEDAFKFTNAVNYQDLDENASLGRDGTFSPYQLNVVLKSPLCEFNGEKGYVYYYYSAVGSTGYFKINGWSFGNEQSKNPTPLTQTSFVNFNPISNAKYLEGNYILEIGCVETRTNSYMQNFKVVVNVKTIAPEFEMTATYPDLPNMNDREIAKGSDNKYYTNTNSIIVSWKDFANEFMTKIDQESISYSYSLNGSQEIKFVKLNEIESNANNHQFKIELPQGATNLSISMTYEVYGADVKKLYTVYYPENYKESKQIIIDRTAPTESISYLQKLDPTVSGVGVDLIRETGDRFSKSTTTGVFNYFTFAVNEDYLITLQNLIKQNNSTQTKVFYYKPLGEKYSNVYLETGLPLDVKSSASNLFNENGASITGWTKVDENAETTNLMAGYYEIVELDLAGNMTIYSVFVGAKNSPSVEVNNQKIVLLNSKVLNIRNEAKISSISFGEGTVYKFQKLIIDGETYYLTPESFSVLGGKVVCTALFNLNGEKIELSSLSFKSQTVSHQLVFVDSTQNTGKTLTLNVASEDLLLTNNGGAKVVSDVVISENGEIVSNKNIALRIETPINSSLILDETSLRIFQIIGTGEDATFEIYDINTLEKSVQKTSSSIVTYYYINQNQDFNRSTFYFAYKDNFETEYNSLVEYNNLGYDRFEGNYDVSQLIQNKNEILVSGNIDVNVSNLFNVELSVRNTANNEISGGYIATDVGNYTKFQLLASTETSSAYFGGLRTFTLSLKYNVPEGIVNNLISAGFNTITNSEEGTIETIVVKIFNQMPNVIITDMNGVNITEKLFQKEINQSDSVNLSFANQSELANNLGITSKVYLRLRGSEQGYFELTSPHTISQSGVYDVYVQNFNDKGEELAFTIKNDFMISDLDVLFYSVVKTNKNGETEIVSPTGNAFEYDKENGLFASKHYIVNTNDYQIVTNGVNVSAQPSGTYGATSVYNIESVSGTIYKATIAVTVVNETNDILSGNKFMYHLGTTYSVPSATNYITSSNKDIYLTKDDVYDEITLRWASFNSIPENKVICYVSANGGESWSVVNATDNGEVSTLTLRNSSTLMFRFEDLAGNVQLFSSPSGFKTTSTNVNFIRSVVFEVNGESPIDNAVYNGEVVITLPKELTHFYSTVPEIHVLRNNEEYQISKNKEGEYVFNETGYYTIYFSAKVETGTKDLNEDVLRFAIINENDARWAFNYVNYNNYNIESIKVNGVELSNELKEFALSVSNEINISAFNKDELGNPYFPNGTYTIRIRTNNSVVGEQTFEFNFWLNMANAPIGVSLPEGQSTKGTITVVYNKANLFETIGECYIKVGSTIIEINEETLSQDGEELKISTPGSHYIQVYTKSGKLVYSYNVNIDKPMDTVTIVLIVVGCVVAVGGTLTFVLLRKKLKVR